MRLLLRLYPIAWRARYGDEFAALLEARPMTPRIVLDVMTGALDARFLALRAFGRGQRMINKLRASQIAVFCAYICFVVAGMGFQKMTEYDDFVAARRHTLVGVTFDAVVVGAVISLLAVLAGGAPLALAALRYAWDHRRRDIALLLATPVIALAVLLGYGAFLLRIVNGGQAQFVTPTTGPTSREKILFVVLLAGFGLAAVASTWAVSSAIRRAEIKPSLFRFARVPALVAALVMLAVSAATLLWGLGLRAADPGLVAGNDGVLASNTTLSWLGIVAVMLGASVVALVAAARGLRLRDGDTSSETTYPALA
ncbi:MAG TPA: hypothetical protein VJN88_02785 [Ktedonobacterales bacterium]|nr:hypothetical protein [Ktedonobacterales bacterium]